MDRSLLHPGKLTWNPKMEIWKMIFLFNWVIFGSMFIFEGCNSLVLDGFSLVKLETCWSANFHDFFQCINLKR